jgi:hypothetical protein
MTTLAPARPNASAVARPMPLAPPVTSTTLPAYEMPLGVGLVMPFIMLPFQYLDASFASYKQYFAKATS